MKEQTKESGKKVTKIDPNSGEPRDIFFYGLKQKDQICYVYHNETEDLILEEIVDFTLKNMEISH